MSYRIAITSNPNYYWCAQQHRFNSLTSGAYKTYRYRGTALRVARQLSALWQVAVEKDTHENHV